MERTTRIPRAELTGVYGAIVKRMARKMLGDVPESIEVVWHHPKVRSFSLGLSRKVQAWDECDESLKSFAHLAVASQVGCSFCLDLGYFHAKNQLNGMPGVRVDVGAATAAVSLVVTAGRITRLYAIANPHKLRRLEATAELRR